MGRTFSESPTYQNTKSLMLKKKNQSCRQAGSGLNQKASRFANLILQQTQEYSYGSGIVGLKLCV